MLSLKKEIPAIISNFNSKKRAIKKVYFNWFDIKCLEKVSNGVKVILNVSVKEHSC